MCVKDKRLKTNDLTIIHRQLRNNKKNLIKYKEFQNNTTKPKVDS